MDGPLVRGGKLREGLMHVELNHGPILRSFSILDLISHSSHVTRVYLSLSLLSLFVCLSSVIIKPSDSIRAKSSIVYLRLQRRKKKTSHA